MADTKKKLLIFVPEFPVLSETFIQREIAKLVEVSAGYSVTIMSLRKGKGAIEDNLKSKVLYARINLFNILMGFITLPSLALSATFKEALGNRNRSYIDNTYLWLKAVGYAHIIRSMEINHIHAHFLSESSTLMYFVSVMLNVQYSISAHARDVFGNNKSSILNPELVPQKAKKAEFIAVCNRKAWLKCQELAGSTYKNKILLHYHGLDPSRLPQKAAPPSNPEKINIVSVGRLVEKKGFEYLLRASELLSKQKVPHIIKIIGPGPLYDTLVQTIAYLGVGNSVSIIGGGQGMPNSETLNLLAQADIFVLPSIETPDGDAEGVPNTLIEAAFMGIPIVTTKTGSIQEFFINGENALTVSPKNHEELAGAIELLVKNPDLGVKIAKNAYKTVEASFDININIQRLNDLFTLNLGLK